MQTAAVLAHLQDVARGREGLDEAGEEGELRGKAARLAAGIANFSLRQCCAPQHILRSVRGHRKRDEQIVQGLSLSQTRRTTTYLQIRCLGRERIPRVRRHVVDGVVAEVVKNPLIQDPVPV